MRSRGGDTLAAIEIADILFDKDAKVVVYDYCLSACASYILVASKLTFVRKGAIVAWHGVLRAFTCSLDGIEFVKRDTKRVDRRKACHVGERLLQFFERRGISDRHTYEPQTAHTKQLFDLALRQGMDRKRVLWMWNPYNYADYFGSRIVYESYPNSQYEVDEIAASVGLRARIIYDPRRN